MPHRSLYDLFKLYFVVVLFDSNPGDPIFKKSQITTTNDQLLYIIKAGKRFKRVPS
jgi:hypothetical protein